jgi:hypothetical protein
MENQQYFELELWGQHILQVWPAGKLAILKHPSHCDIQSDECQHKLMKYIEAEGIFDKIPTKLIMLDSYIEPSS